MDARQTFIATCESMRDAFSMYTLPAKKDAFICGAACVDAQPGSIGDFNRCVAGCQDKVTRMDNIARTYLDAVTDRVELCLQRSSETEKDKCYLTETEWIIRQKPRWQRRVDEVLSGKVSNEVS